MSTGTLETAEPISLENVLAAISSIRTIRAHFSRQTWKQPFYTSGGPRRDRLSDGRPAPGPVRRAVHADRSTGPSCCAASVTFAAAGGAGGGRPTAGHRHRRLRGGRLHGQPDRRVLRGRPRGFTLRGTKFVKLRNKISRAHRSGLDGAPRCPRSPSPRPCRRSTQGWLASKGKHTKELRVPGGGVRRRAPAAPAAVRRHDRRRAGRLHLLLTRRTARGRAGCTTCPAAVPDGPPGVMEAINARGHRDVPRRGRAVAALRLHPVHRPVAELERCPARAGGSVAGRSAAHARRVGVPGATQLAYKKKWAPHAVLPEYVAFSGRASLAGFLRVFKAANAL